jgi:hypothetical protein
VFSDQGVGGVQLASSATLHLQIAGSFDPATGSVSSGNYYDSTAGTFTASSATTIKVVQMKEKDFQKTTAGTDSFGVDTSALFLMRPLINVSPYDLVGVRLDYGNRTFGILRVGIQRMGNSQIIWEVMCQ